MILKLIIALLFGYNGQFIIEQNLDTKEYTFWEIEESPSDKDKTISVQPKKDSMQEVGEGSSHWMTEHKISRLEARLWAIVIENKREELKIKQRYIKPI